MKIAVILENAPGCVLERRELDIKAEADMMNDAVNDAASEVVASWILSVGDTIKIREAGAEG